MNDLGGKFIINVQHSTAMACPEPAEADVSATGKKLNLAGTCAICTKMLRQGGAHNLIGFWRQVNTIISVRAGRTEAIVQFSVYINNADFF